MAGLMLMEPSLVHSLAHVLFLTFSTWGQPWCFLSRVQGGGVGTNPDQTILGYVCLHKNLTQKPSGFPVSSSFLSFKQVALEKGGKPTLCSDPQTA